MEDFSDATLVLVGHGSTRNADSSAPVRRHAEEFRGRGSFHQVLECFWKEEPSIAGALRQAVGRRIFVVPLTVSEGWFTEEVIPRELALTSKDGAGFARVRRLGPQTLHYCGPVGTHAGMTGIILARAAEVLAENPGAGRRPEPRELSLFVAGHGTAKNANSRRAVECQVQRIAGQGIYASVQALFLEEAPFIGECYRLAATRDLVVVPFFISDGLHGAEDIPGLLGEPEAAVKARVRNGGPPFPNPTERNGHRVWYAAGIGRDMSLAEVVMDRVREAGAGSSAR